MWHIKGAEFARDANFELHREFSPLQNDTLLIIKMSNKWNRNYKWNSAANSYCFVYFLLPVFTYFSKSILPQSPPAASHNALFEWVDWCALYKTSIHLFSSLVTANSWRAKTNSLLSTRYANHHIKTKLTDGLVLLYLSWEYSKSSISQYAQTNWLCVCWN